MQERQGMRTSIGRLLSPNFDPVQCPQIKEMHRVEDRWLHLIILASMHNDILFMSHHPHIATGYRSDAGNCELLDDNCRVAESHDVQLADHLSIAILAPVQVDSLLLDIRVQLRDGLIIVYTISTPSMEDSQSLILRKPTLQFLRHLLYSQLIPIILFIVIIHEVIEQFVILIDAPRDDQELAVDALAVECAAGGLCLGEFESFYF